MMRVKMLVLRKCATLVICQVVTVGSHTHVESITHAMCLWHKLLLNKTTVHVGVLKTVASGGKLSPRSVVHRPQLRSTMHTAPGAVHGVWSALTHSHGLPRPQQADHQPTEKVHLKTATPPADKLQPGAVCSQLLRCKCQCGIVFQKAACARHPGPQPG